MKESNWWERFRAWLAYLIFPEPNDWYVEACERANRLEDELAELKLDHENLIRRANELEESHRALLTTEEEEDE